GIRDGDSSRHRYGNGHEDGDGHAHGIKFDHHFSLYFASLSASPAVRSPSSPCPPCLRGDTPLLFVLCALRGESPSLLCVLCGELFLSLLCVLCVLCGELFFLLLRSLCGELSL